MLDHHLRAYKDELLRPLTGCMGHIAPNTITVVAALVGLAAAGAAAISLYWLALGLWLASRVLDGLDGLVARRCSRQSDFGGYLDIVLDFVVYAALPIGLYFGAPTGGVAVSLVTLLGSFYVNAASWMYLSAILEKRQAGAGARNELTSVTMPDGLIGGTETILFYSAFLIWPGQLPWLFGAMAVLVMVGIGWRLWWAHGYLSNGQRPGAEASPLRARKPQGVPGVKLPYVRASSGMPRTTPPN